MSKLIPSRISRTLWPNFSAIKIFCTSSSSNKISCCFIVLLRRVAISVTTDDKWDCFPRKSSSFIFDRNSGVLHRIIIRSVLLEEEEESVLFLY